MTFQDLTLDKARLAMSGGGALVVYMVPWKATFSCLNISGHVFRGLCGATLLVRHKKHLVTWVYFLILMTFQDLTRFHLGQGEVGHDPPERGLVQSGN